MKNRISIEECKRIQLEMLIEIDEFCRKNNIKYMLAFGTLLGAIRHKGYIPWDDDVDISMPIEDMLRFKEIFRSDKLEYRDIDTDDNYEWHFSRITHKSTYNKKGLIFKSYGINIDLYPLIEVSSSKEVTNELLKEAQPIVNKKRIYNKTRNKLLKVLPIRYVPRVKQVIKKYRDFWFKIFPEKGGGRFHCLAGPISLYEKHTFDFNPFDDLIELEFEGRKFMGPARYHDYLTKRYGDYMQFPPKEQQHPYHANKYYWKKQINSK